MTGAFIDISGVCYQADVMCRPPFFSSLTLSRPWLKGTMNAGFPPTPVTGVLRPTSRKRTKQGPSRPGWVESGYSQSAGRMDRFARWQASQRSACRPFAIQAAFAMQARMPAHARKERRYIAAPWGRSLWRLHNGSSPTSRAWFPSHNRRAGRRLGAFAQRVHHCASVRVPVRLLPRMLQLGKQRPFSSRGTTDRWTRISP